MRKTVLEWLSESKLLTKKVQKKEKELLSKMYSVTLVHNENKDFINENVKSEYESLVKLKSNLDKIKDAIMQYNATTKIKVENKEMSIAYALGLYNPDDDYSFEYNVIRASAKFVQEVDKAKIKSQQEKSDLDRQLLSKNNISEKDKAMVEIAKASYDVLVKDPLNILELASKLQEEKETFENEVNNKINLSNALTELEINLD